MSESTSDPVSEVRRVFDAVADDYDQSGVAFFRPIAADLVERLQVTPGERVLDIGCGRGAATVPLAVATGPSGTVVAGDLSPAMVAHTRVAAEVAGLGQITVRELDATRVDLPDQSFDVLASSLVLFFLPDPGAALADWRRLTRPGGRVGVTTFGEPDPVLKQLFGLFDPFMGSDTLDPLADREDNPFLSDEGVERLFSDAGWRGVRTVRKPFPVRFADAHAWRAWTMSTGQRLFWSRMDDRQREDTMDRATAVLEPARGTDGVAVVHQEVRHTLAHAPEPG